MKWKKVTGKEQRLEQLKLMVWTLLEMRLFLLHGSYGFPAWVLSLAIPCCCDITDLRVGLL